MLPAVLGCYLLLLVGWRCLQVVLQQLQLPQRIVGVVTGARSVGALLWRVLGALLLWRKSFALLALAALVRWSAAAKAAAAMERQASNHGKVPRLEGGASSSSSSSSSHSSLSAGAATGEPLSALTWNVWFSDLQLQQRMRGVCETLAREKPRFVALQEVTPPILKLLQPQLVLLGYDVRVQEPSDYFCALAVRDAKWDTVRELRFANSKMRRGLLYGRATLPGVGSVLVATTHLESPTPQAKTAERQAQLASCFKALGDAMSGSSPQPRAVLLMGDLNWTEVRDGVLHMPMHWRDAWEVMHAGLGYFDSCTYNSRTNKMLSGSLSYRADRMLFWGCLEPSAARMVGTEPLEGVTTVRNGVVKPVYCSDHYGVLATFVLRPLS